MAFLKEDSGFTHVIAIDFGTGASGYGLAPKLSDPQAKPRIEVFNPCDEKDDQKTSTAILFDSEHNFLAFGQPALQRYAEILDDDETALLFQNYKMHLLNMHENAQAVDKSEMPLMPLVAESLRFISQRALEKLQEQVGKTVPSKIRWVLTVPALWSEEHKQFMKRAALEAGIIEDMASPNLLLCLEPEGASIQCREDSEESVRNQLTKGSVVMVLDCGGGTVDITIHKLECEPEERFLCKELLPSSGGCEWGSRYVDKYFEEFLREFFGAEFYDTYETNAMARLEILKHFEMLKRKFNPGVDDKSRVQLGYLGGDLSSAKLDEFINRFNDNNLPEFNCKKRGSSSMEVAPALMRSFFEPLFENIKSKVEQLIDEIKKKGEKLDFIFLVGGFSESPFLKSEIKKKFENENVQILVPTRPQVSVIRGACMYGLNPRSITSRIAKKTYGINTLTTFDSERHPEEKKVIIEGEEFCEDVFDAFIKKGDAIAADEVHTKTYCPVRSRQTVMRIIFYCTDNYDADFIDEECVQQLGELSIDIGNIHENEVNN